MVGLGIPGFLAISPDFHPGLSLINVITDFSPDDNCLLIPLYSGLLKIASEYFLMHQKREL
jgi:hypothetical protein